MYPFILAIHNILRWIVLILGLLAAVMAWIGWLRKREWQAGDRKPGSFFAISADIQLLVGLLLYVFFSPLTRSAFSDFAAAMQVADLRFFALEHAVYMLLVVLFAHLGLFHGVQEKMIKRDGLIRCGTVADLKCRQFSEKQGAG